MKCNICEEGNLVRCVIEQTHIIDGSYIVVPMHFCECDNCKSQTATGGNTLMNAILMKEALMKSKLTNNVTNEELPLWSDDKSCDDILDEIDNLSKECLATVIYNLFEDVQCLKENLDE